MEAFSKEVRENFEQYIRRPEHTNRARMSIEKRRIIEMFLRKPSLKPSNEIEINLRSQVHGYRLDEDPTSNILWRLRDSGHPIDRKVISIDMTFNTIVKVHSQHAHPGKNKTFDLLRQEFYGITKEEVSSYSTLYEFLLMRKI